MRQIAMKALTALLFTLLAADHLRANSVRLAIVPSTQSARAAADLLTVQITSHTNITLLERTEVDRVYRELTTAAQQTGNELRLGQALGADGVLIIEPRVQQTSSSLALTLIAVKPGVVLSVSHYPWPLPNAVEWSKQVAGQLLPLWPKLSVLPKDAIAVSVVNLRSALQSTEARWTERNLTLLLTERLTREQRLFVLDRRRMDLLSTERQMGGWVDTPFWNSGYLLEGTIDRDVLSETNLTLDLRLQPPNGKPATALRVAGERKDMAGVVERAAQAVLKTLNQQPTATFDSAAEAQRYLDEARWAVSWRMFPEALRAVESSCALSSTNREALLFRIESYRSAGDVRRAGYGYGNPDIIGRLTPAAIEATTHALDLYEQATKGGIQGGSTNTDWFYRGRDILSSASEMLLHFGYLPGSWNAVQNELSDLRTSTRRIVDLLLDEKYFGTSNRLSVRSLAVTATGVWHDSPQNGIDAYRKLIGSDDFRKVRDDFIKLYAPPVLAAWNPTDAQAATNLWPKLRAELLSSPNSRLQLEARILEFTEQQLWKENRSRDLISAVTNLFDAMLRARSVSPESFDYSLSNAAKFVIYRAINLGNSSPEKLEIRQNLLPNFERQMAGGPPQPRKEIVTSLPPAWPPPVAMPATQTSADAILVRRHGPSFKFENGFRMDESAVLAHRQKDGKLWIQYYFTVRTATGSFHMNDEGWPQAFNPTVLWLDDPTKGYKYVSYPAGSRPLSASGWTPVSREFEWHEDQLCFVYGGKLISFGVNRNEWQEVPLPFEGEAIITSVGSFLYFSTRDALVQFNPRTKQLQILASNRRTPAANPLDTASLRFVPVFDGGSGSILTVAGNVVYRWSQENGWREELQLGGGKIRASENRDTLVLCATDQTVVRNTDSWRMAFGSPVKGVPANRSAWRQQRMDPKSAFGFEGEIFWVAQQGTNLEPSRIIQTRTESIGTLLCFRFDRDDPIRVPLHFATEDRRHLSPFVTRTGISEEWLDVDLIFTPTAFVLIGRSQPGWWVIPRDEVMRRIGPAMVQQDNLAKARGQESENTLLRYAGYESLFQRYDSNSSGGLEFREMYELLRIEPMLAPVRPINGGAFPWRDVFNAYDTNRDRRIDLAELKNLLMHPELSLAAPSGIWATNAPAAWRDFDQNRDGYIDINEVRVYSKARGALRPQ